MVGSLPGPGSELRISGMDCEVDRQATYEESVLFMCLGNQRFKRATSCLNNAANTPVAPAGSLAQRQRFKPPVMVGRTVIATPLSHISAPARPATPVTPVAGPSNPYKAIPSSTFYGTPKPAAKKIVIGEKSSKEREAWGGALHDPHAAGALVMQRPTDNEAKRRYVISPCCADLFQEDEDQRCSRRPLLQQQATRSSTRRCPRATCDIQR